MMTLLLDVRSDPNRINDNEGRVPRTSLHQAAERGHVEAVLLLLKHRADPMIRNSQGNTARAATQESLDDIYPEDTLETAFNPPNAAEYAENLTQVIAMLEEAERRIGQAARKIALSGE